MTHLLPGSKIHREITIDAIDQPVSVDVTSSGLSFWIKGSRKKVWLPWSRAIEAGITGEDIPSFLMGKPLEFLQHQAAKTRK